MGNPVDQKLRQHLEQEAREHAGRRRSLEEAEHIREKFLEERKERAHHEVEHAKEVAARLREQKNYVESRAAKYDSTNI